MTTPQPDPPVRGYSFSTFQVNDPATPLPGDRVDAELDRTNDVVAALIAFVGQAIDAAGRVRAGTVTWASLDPAIREGLAGSSLAFTAALIAQAEAAAAAAGSSATAASGAATAASDTKAQIDASLATAATTTPYTRTLLQAANAAAARTTLGALGATGDQSLGGNLAVSGNAAVNGRATAAALSAPTIYLSADERAYATGSGSFTILQGDVDDRLVFDKTTNVWRFNIANAQRLRITPDVIELRGDNVSVPGRAVIGPQPTAMALSDTAAALTVSAPNATGDANTAAIAFLVTNRYAVKLGLRHDGIFGVGGWSAQPWVWTVNMATGTTSQPGPAIAPNTPKAWGLVTLEGALSAGHGVASATRVAQGHYAVAFSSALSGSNYAVLVTPLGSNGTAGTHARSWWVGSRTASDFSVFFSDNNADANLDAAFSFVVMALN